MRQQCISGGNFVEGQASPLSCGLRKVKEVRQGKQTQTEGASMGASMGRERAPVFCFCEGQGTDVFAGPPR